MHELRLIGIIDEAPFNPLTWSGSSKFFFEALRDRGVLVDALSANPGAFTRRIAQAISFSPNITQWRIKYHLNTFLFRQMSKKVIERLIPTRESFDAILQVGAWYNLLDNKHLQDKFFCSYHDGNLATQLKRPDVSYDLNAGYIKRALDFEKRLYQGLDLTFTMSEWLRTSFIEDFGCDPDKVVTVGAGVNFKCVPDIENKDYSKHNILFIGVDFERKGGKVVIDAFKQVKQEIPDASLTIIGPNLENTSERVMSLGRIRKNSPDGEKRLHDAYIDASIFVMPSFYEPFGIVFAEAMAYKLPCICANVCAMPEIVDNGKTGFVIPSGDNKTLAHRIIELFRNENKLKMFGEAGYRKYLENYTWEKVASKIVYSISDKFSE